MAAGRRAVRAGEVTGAPWEARAKETAPQERPCDVDMREQLFPVPYTLHRQTAAKVTHWGEYRESPSS